MTLARSRVTAQGQISVPAEVRKRFGIGPGSLVEWDVKGDLLIVRRSGRHSLEDVRAILAPKRPRKPKTLEELKQGIEEYIRKKHARR
jgi:AbrB family looped-hinge helix DNA binding protein